MGLLQPIFGMEYATSYDKMLAIFSIDSEQKVVFTLQMESPENLEEFKNKIEAHFSRYYRCACRVLRVRSSVFFKIVTDSSLLRKRFTVHDQALDLAQL